MKRREFISLVGGAAAWPFAARAQQGQRMPRIGIFISFAETDPEAQGYVAAFREGLQKLGWTEGQNIQIEFRWATPDPAIMQQFAKELVASQPNLILSSGTPATRALLQQTRTIPIIFATVVDPVGSRQRQLSRLCSLVWQTQSIASLLQFLLALAANQQTDLAGKRVEILRELVPDLRRLAFLGSVGNPATELDKREVQAVAGALGLKFVAPEFRRAEDIASAFEAINGKVDALLVTGEPLTMTNRVRINTLALVARLPTMFGFREFVEGGGLISYGVNLADQYRRAADYTDKILRGTKPGDIPVEQPTKFDLVINVTTAKALGLPLLESLRARADEVIE